REAISDKSDQYSFCVALWEALFGELPGRASRHDGATAAGRLGVPSHLRRALLRGLDASPERPHPSMRAPLRALTHQRSRALAPMGAALAATAVASVVTFAVAHRPDACAATAGELTGVWDAPAKTAVDGALLATKRPYAAETAQRVDALLDSY